MDKNVHYRVVNGQMVRVSTHKHGVCSVYNLTNHPVGLRIVVWTQGAQSTIRLIKGDGRNPSSFKSLEKLTVMVWDSSRVVQRILSELREGKIAA